MFELIIIPSLLGLGLAADYFQDQADKGAARARPGLVRMQKQQTKAAKTDVKECGAAQSAEVEDGGSDKMQPAAAAPQTAAEAVENLPDAANDNETPEDAATMAQGAEADQPSFVVAAASQVTGAPAMLFDFDMRDDIFSVVMLEETDHEPVVEFRHNPATDQLTALVNGVEVAVLNDIVEEDVPFIHTYVTTMPTLNALAA